jgi:acyl dehydratase
MLAIAAVKHKRPARRPAILQSRNHGSTEALQERTDKRMTKPKLEVGSSVSVSRTISESDVYLFGGLTGDLGPNHMDEEYSKVHTAYGTRVAHGAYLVGLSSAASTLLGQTYDKGGYRGASYGYDRVRFIKPVLIGDTVTMTYTIKTIDPTEMKTYAEVIGTNQRGDVCFAAIHIGKGVPPKGTKPA